MRPTALLALIAVLFCARASAQDIVPVDSFTFTQTPDDSLDLSPFDNLRPVVRPSVRLTQRVILVVDVSGSMKDEGRISRALQAVRHVMENPSDDFEVAIVTFSTKTERWPGVPEPTATPPVPVGWARLPSMIALTEGEAFVSSREAQGTLPVPALIQAITEPRDNVSVVFVTDGDFIGPDCVTALRKAQLIRGTQGRHPAPVLVYGVGSKADQMAHLATIGREGGGGFWVDRAPTIKRWH